MVDTALPVCTAENAESALSDSVVEYLSFDWSVSGLPTLYVHDILKCIDSNPLDDVSSTEGGIQRLLDEASLSQ